MRMIRSFALIGAGAFAAGMCYSKSSFDDGGDNRLVFALSLAIAVAGLFDLIALAVKGHFPPLGPSNRVKVGVHSSDAAAID